MVARVKKYAKFKIAQLAPTIPLMTSRPPKPSRARSRATTPKHAGPHPTGRASIAKATSATTLRARSGKPAPKPAKSAKPRPQSPQLPLRFRTWGGARAGAGRPRTSTSVSHLRRAAVSRHVPLHVTLRLVERFPNLRTRVPFRIIRAALSQTRAGGARIVHYSVQSNHLHFIVEALNKSALARGIQALTIRLAKSLNRALGRTGRVFADRFHARPLKTPLEVRRALVYVLNNYRKHTDGKGPRLPLSFVDGYSSGLWFDGWDPEFVHAPPDKRAPRDPAPELDAGIVPARSFLLTTAWRRHGLVRPFETPDAAPKPAPARARRRLPD